VSWADAIVSQSVVILNGGTADVRDPTTKSASMMLKGIPSMHAARMVLATAVPLHELRKIPRRAGALLRMTSRER
jgi:hypothetical protein